MTPSCEKPPTRRLSARGHRRRRHRRGSGAGARLRWCGWRELLARAGSSAGCSFTAAASWRVAGKRTLRVRGVKIEAVAVSLPAQTCRRQARRGQLPAASVVHQDADSFSNVVSRSAPLVIRAAGASCGRVATRLTAMSSGASPLEASQRTCTGV